ncbi:MDR family MFS transporter [Streptomyces sp. NBC_01343]|uniref:MDR family MFS transporter n=1 Tax=Streptomyces sp. NBC_01343 TaxID=2903832 RepID=UPI002E0EDD13|nr:MDR family MFS transporter [Streptomyces sp. NBC_01343]
MDQLIAEDPTRIGPYRLIARLGAGGMGLVYLGRSEGGRTVAVKVVQAEYAGHPEFRRRFAREVAAARRVGGSCTAAVLDADPEAAVPWVATQYIPGPDLHAVVAEHFGPLPEHSVRTLANRLALALQAVHEAGLIHRDLKPSNVLVTVDGPRVIDFGIARAMDSLAEEHSLHTRTGMLIGSPGFMSPEQVRGLELTPASDVFCLGAVLVYAATGRLLFGATDTGLNAHLFRVAEEEADLTGVPDALADLVRACLHKDPARRPSPRAVAERTAPDQAAEWLPGAVLAQLGRHAAELLDFAPSIPAQHQPEPQAQAPVPVPPQTPAPQDQRPAQPLPLPPAYAPASPAPFDPARGFGPPPGAPASPWPPPPAALLPGAATAHPGRWWGLAVIALVQLMVLLQAANLSVALPAVQADLHLSTDGLGTLANAYFIAFGAVLLIGGHIADLAGRKQTLIVGLLGCAAASALGGSAGDSGTLVWARVLQGVFGALLTASALSLVATGFTDPKERGRAFGIYAAITAAGTALGMAEGGWLLTAMSWRWSLYGGVLIAVIGLIGTLTLVHERPGRTDGHFDAPGVLLGSGGVAALLYGLNEAQLSGWATPLTLILLVGGVLLLVGFLWWQSAAANPLLPACVFKDPNRAGSLLGMLLAGAGTVALYPVVGYYLETVLRYDPAMTGAAFLPMVAAIVIGSTQVSARLLPRVAPRVPILAGLALTAAGLFLLTRLGFDSSYAIGVLPALLLIGLGIGTAFVPILATVTGAVAAERSGGAAAAVLTAQELGLAIGAALLDTVISAHVDRLRAGSVLPSMIEKELLRAETANFWWAAGSVLLAVLVAALMMRSRGPRGDAGAVSGAGA